MTIWARGEREEQRRRDGGETKPREGVIWWEAGGGEEGGLRSWGVKRLVSFTPPPQAHTRFFLFEKSLSLLLVFPSALTGFLRLPVYFLLSQESGLRWR